MRIELYTGTLIHDVPDCGTVMVAVNPELAHIELEYAARLTSVGKRVQAIKHLRSVFSCGLKEAHRMTQEAADERAKGRKATTPYTLVNDGEVGEIICESCGYREEDSGQFRCRSCGKLFSNHEEDTDD